ncbi:hypothetical protein CBL_09755 [Carabus blaptoides fortunei]
MWDVEALHVRRTFGDSVFNYRNAYDRVPILNLHVQWGPPSWGHHVNSSITAVSYTFNPSYNQELLIFLRYCWRDISERNTTHDMLNNNRRNCDNTNVRQGPISRGYVDETAHADWTRNW